MNPDPEKLRELLDEVLPSSAEYCGPSSADVLHLLRNDRQRRRRRRTGAAALAVVVLALVLRPWDHVPRAASVIPAPAAPVSLVIRNVNDEQLFGLLQGTPIALMETPNGERTLFVIEH